MTKKKKAGGRPAKYDPEMVHKAYLYARSGHTNKEIQEMLGIKSYSTFCVWQNKHPEFKDALREGRKFILPELEKSMIKAALGYWVEEETTQFNSRPLRSSSQICWATLSMK